MSILQAYAFINENHYVAYSDAYVSRCEDMLKLLEPFQTAPEAVLYYLELLIGLAINRSMHLLHDTTMKLARQAEQVYNSYFNRDDYPVPLTVQDLFGITELDTKRPITKDSLFLALQFALYRGHMSDWKPPYPSKYIVPATKYLLSLAFELKNDYNGYGLLMLRYLSDMIDLYITESRIKQYAHVLAVIMHSLVQLRRVVPEDGRSRVDFLQGIMSAHFVLWATLVLCAGNEKFDEAFEPLHEGPLEPGMQLYYDQFPVQPVPYKDMEPRRIFMKRAKSWIKRALTFLSLFKLQDQEKHVLEYLDLTMLEFAEALAD